MSVTDPVVVAMGEIILAARRAKLVRSFPWSRFAALSTPPRQVFEVNAGEGVDAVGVAADAGGLGRAVHVRHVVLGAVDEEEGLEALPVEPARQRGTRQTGWPLGAR